MKLFNELVESFTVKSLANGNMLIEIKYKAGTPGWLGRIAIAGEIAEMVRRLAKDNVKDKQR
jgi:hypothetical protein